MRTRTWRLSWHFSGLPVTLARAAYEGMKAVRVQGQRVTAAALS
jgi:hypothetical protein